MTQDILKPQEQTQQPQQQVQQAQVEQVQQAQVQQEQQPTKQEIVEMIEKLKKKILADWGLHEMYDTFRYYFAELHEDYLTKAVMYYLINSRMLTNYIYPIVKSFLTAAFLNTSKVKKLIEQTLTIVENEQIDIEHDEYEYLFNEKLFYTVLLTQLIYPKSDTLRVYTKAYYFYAVVKSIKAALGSKLKNDIMLDLRGLEEKAAIAIENEFLNQIENELAKEIDDTETTEKINLKEEIKKELETIKNRRITIRNQIIQLIRNKMKTQKLDDNFILRLKKFYKNKRLYRLYILIKKVKKLENKLQQQETDINELDTLLTKILAKYTITDVLRYKAEAEVMCEYLSKIQIQQ